MKKILCAVLMLAAGIAYAADENARRDRNKFPTQMGVSETNGETRRIKTTNDGFVIVVSSSPGGTGGGATEATLSTINGKTPVLGAAATAASVPVNIASDQTVPVSAASLPLPAGAATSANQGTGNTSLSSIDGKIPAQGAAVTANSTPVNIASDQTVPISAASLPLPAGAATAANQATGNASLSSIDGKLATLGQKASVGSMPVVIASDQSVISVDDNSGSLTVDAIQLDVDDLTFAADKVDASGSTLGANSGIDIGDVTINNAGAGSAVNVQDGGNSLTVDDGGTTLSVDDGGGSLTIDAVNLPLPSGAATSSLQSTGNASLASIDGKIPASPAQDRTTAAAPSSVRLSDGSAFYKATTPSDTQPISAASLPLPSGAATSANQTTGNASLSSIDGKLASLGQKASSGSLPVVIASDQSDVPVAVNGAGNDTPTESCTNVTVVAQVMASSVTRESNLICNEGPEIARCGSGSVTSSTGQRLLVDQCYTMDGAKPFRGAISCVSVGGPSTKICVAESS